MKRWCDGGVIPTIRTVGGHRRITFEGLQRFLQQTERTLTNPDVLGLPALMACRRTAIPGAETDHQRRFREALAAGEEPQCRQILRAQIEGGQTRSEAAELLITDAMHGLGEAWQCNELDVYQERRACAISHRLIGELIAELPPTKTHALTAVGGAPEGDHYQLPSGIVELSLRELGWRSVCLGNNLPLESFSQAAHDYAADLVWISVSAIEDTATFVAKQNKLASSLGESVPLFVGGRALCDDIRPRLRYTAHCDNLRQFVDLVAIMQLSLRR